jgi:hypothetical protein
MSSKLDMVVLGQRASALKNGVKATTSCPCFFAKFFNEFRHIVDLFDRDHVDLGVVLPCNLDRQQQRVTRMFRAIIGMRALFSFGRNPPELCDLSLLVRHIFRLWLRQQVMRKIKGVGNDRRYHGAGNHRGDQR